MTNQANIFRATMANYEEVLKATEIAENANGSATERMAIYTESLTAKINSLKTAWTQFVNNLNIDNQFGGLIDIATKFIELLDILLNKIPILSSVLKTLITVQGINILAGATVKAISKIAGPDGIAGLLSGLITLNSTVGEVGTTATASSVGINTMSSALSALGISANMALGVVGVLIATLAAGYYVWDNFISIEGRLENANKKLQESQQDLDETQSKVNELLSEKEELESISTEQLTSGEQKRLDIITEQLDVYNQILEAKKKQAEQDQEDVKKLEYEQIKGRYTGSNSLQSGREFASGALSLGQSLYALDNSSFSENLAKQEQLVKLQGELNQGEEKYGYNLETVNELINYNNEVLEQQLLNLQEDKALLIENGQTGTEEYKNLCEQIEVYKALMNPDDWEENTISELVDFDSIIEEIKTGGKEASDAISQTAKDVAQQITNDQALKSAAEVAFNIDLSTLEGYNELVRILQEDIPNAYRVSSESANDFALTANSVFNSYLDTVESLTDSQTTLNTALGEMQYNGQLTTETVRDLISAYPELSNKISIQNGQLKIEVKYLNEVWEAQKNKEKNSIDSQIRETESVIENTKTRIDAYTTEAEALNAMAQAGDSSAERVQHLKKVMESNPTDSTAYINAAREFGTYMTEQNLQIEKQNAVLERLKAAREALDSLGGLSPTSPSGSTSGSSGTSNDPEKQAYELKKSEIELIQKQLELEKSKLEQQKDQIEQQKDLLEIKKSEIELQKQQKEEQLEIIQYSEEGIDNIIELIKEMNKQDYENLKNNLEDVKEYISDFKDALDAVRDTYDDIVESTKEKVQAEKESLDNQRKLQENAMSIAEIQAQLAEIQYDDSSDAQAKRIELTAQLNEKQKDMQEELEDQAYDASIDSLEATKDKVDSIFESINEILEISEEAIADYITYISDELQSESNLYLQAVTQFNDTSEGAREELYNRLIEWNKAYGDSIDATVTEPWNQAVDAVEKYKAAVGSADIDSIRQYLGNQDISLSESIRIDEQTIDGLTSQIDEIQISMDKVDSQINQFEQAINKVKTSLSQLEINYQTGQNAATAASIGASGTGNDYAYNLIKQLLVEAGIDTSELPATYQDFIDGLSLITDATETTSDSIQDFGKQVETSGDQIDSSGEKAESAGQKVEQTEQPLSTLAEQGNRAADALGNVATESETKGSSSTNSLQSVFELLTGGDVGKFIESVATKAISRYLPKLLTAGINAIGKLHDGTSEVKKSNSWLDKMLGLGQDETAKILKVGEAVIPDYANNINNVSNDRGIFAQPSVPNTANIRTTNSSSLNIDMGDLDITGIDTTELRNELENIKNESANRVYSTLNRYIKVGGYRNVKNRYN